jgi:hypothetical protein
MEDSFLNIIGIVIIVGTYLHGSLFWIVVATFLFKNWICITRCTFYLSCEKISAAEEAEIKFDRFIWITSFRGDET